MTTKEAADFLGISTRTIHRWVDSGRIKPIPSAPSLLRPAKLMFKREDVEKLNQAGCESSPQN